MSQAATLNARQLQQVLDYCRTRRHALRDRTMILVSHWSGMRVKEIAALRWCDVVNSDGTIKAEVRLTADQTKGQRGRTVLLPQRLQAELARYAAANQATPNQQPVFATERSSGFSANTLTHVINGIYRSAGLDGATSHSGRRTFITTLAESGVSARVLMSLAGHQNLSTTQRYIDIKPSMLRAAVELL